MLLQGIFLIQGLMSGLFTSPHWQVGSLPLAPPRKPKSWGPGIDLRYLRGSSWRRNWPRSPSFPADSFPSEPPGKSSLIKHRNLVKPHITRHSDRIFAKWILWDRNYKWWRAQHLTCCLANFAWNSILPINKALGLLVNFYHKQYCQTLFTESNSWIFS